MFEWFKKWNKILNPVSKTDIHVKQELHATVIRACSNCGAAGVDGYGKDVGDVCPTCGAGRPPNENKGLIWRKLK